MSSMSTWPTTRSGIRARITTYRRSLAREAGTAGGFGDGYGKRYWLFMLYFLLREDTAARSYMDWYRATFPDDCGEAMSSLCWALLLFRLHRPDEARYRFIQAMECSIPVVATIADDYRGPYGVWNEELPFAHQVDQQIVAAMTEEERTWIRQLWRDSAIRTVCERRVAYERALPLERDPAVRERLVTDHRAFVMGHSPPPLLALSPPGTPPWLVPIPGRSAADLQREKIIRLTAHSWTHSDR